MTTNLFEEVRRRVSAREAAAHCGFPPNRAGFIRCPFHGERTPSLKFFDSGSFYCFGCRAGGSCVDFVARLYGLDPLGAARWLNEQFHLGLSPDRRQTPQERADAAQAAAKRQALSHTAKAFAAWREGTLDRLDAALRVAHRALRDCQNLDTLTGGEVLAVRWRAAMEHWADCLLSGDMARQMDIFRDRKEVDTLCSQILSSTPTKSSAV